MVRAHSSTLVLQRANSRIKRTCVFLWTSPLNISRQRWCHLNMDITHVICQEYEISQWKWPVIMVLFQQHPHLLSLCTESQAGWISSLKWEKETVPIGRGSKFCCYSIVNKNWKDKSAKREGLGEGVPNRDCFVWFDGNIWAVIERYNV